MGLFIYVGYSILVALENIKMKLHAFVNGPEFECIITNTHRTIWV